MGLRAVAQDDPRAPCWCGGAGRGLAAGSAEGGWGTRGKDALAVRFCASSGFHLPADGSSGELQGRMATRLSPCCHHVVSLPGGGLCVRSAGLAAWGGCWGGSLQNHLGGQKGNSGGADIGVDLKQKTRKE